MFFHSRSYKNSCFTELVNNSSFLVLMTCSFKDFLQNVALDFVLLVLKTCSQTSQPVHEDLQRLTQSVSVRSQSLKLKFGYSIILQCCYCQIIQNMGCLQKPKVDFNFGQPLYIYVLAIRRYLRILSKLFCITINTFFVKGLCCHIAGYIIQLAPLETLLLNSQLTSTVNKTHHGPVIAPFLYNLSNFFQLH